VSKQYSPAFQAKMVQRMTGPNAVSATRLARETGMNQETLSKWLRDARTLPLMPPDKPPPRPKRSIEDKARIVSEAAKLDGDAQLAYLQREGVRFAELEQWRLALADEGRPERGTANQIRRLERELKRKEKALAEAAALLVLRKKVEALWGDEDDEPDEGNEP
jgi:transposase-like protein